MQIETGDSRVGGTKAWITSEFAVSQTLALFVFLFYGFFIAVAAGMPIIRDDELKIGELLRSSSLTVGEYVWGKFSAVLLAFLVVLALHLAAMMFFNHLVPNQQSLEIRGPFVVSNYVIPAIVLAVPTIVFLCGISFAVGEWTRRPIFLFFLPVAELLPWSFFLWGWSPLWLSHRLNRALMLIDPSAFRWLNETWLKGDRGVHFYNEQAVPFDAGLLASRFCFLAIGLGAVALSQLHLSATLRGTAAPRRSWLDSPQAQSVRCPRAVGCSRAGARSSSGDAFGHSGLLAEPVADCADRTARARTEPGLISLFR